jgi:hypothetical protein
MMCGDDVGGSYPVAGQQGEEPQPVACEPGTATGVFIEFRDDSGFVRAWDGARLDLAAAPGGLTMVALRVEVRDESQGAHRSCVPLTLVIEDDAGHPLAAVRENVPLPYHSEWSDSTQIMWLVFEEEQPQRGDALHVTATAAGQSREVTFFAD